RRPARPGAGQVSKVDALHAVVAGVEDVDPAAAVHRQGPRVVQLPRLPAGRAPAAERLALGRELLHAGVAELGDVEDDPLAAPAEGEVVRVRQLPRRLARLAPAADQLAVAREDLDAVVAGVGDVQVAVGPEGEGADAAELPGLGAAAAPPL